MIDWPKDPRSGVTPAEKSVLLRRLRRTVKELQELGFTVPPQLMALARSASGDD
ncbi:MAG: hypothetical protein AAFQ79_09420 [Pseudomonadota bacterium]